MPGGTMLYEQVISNIHFLLKRMGLTTLAQGIRIRLPQTWDYYYPDILVTAEKITKASFAEAPILIAEPDFCQVTLFYKNETGE